MYCEVINGMQHFRCFYWFCDLFPWFYLIEQAMLLLIKLGVLLAFFSTQACFWLFHVCQDALVFSATPQPGNSYPVCVEGLLLPKCRPLPVYLLNFLMLLLAFFSSPPWSLWMTALINEFGVICKLNNVSPLALPPLCCWLKCLLNGVGPRISLWSVRSSLVIRVLVE